MFLCIVIFTKLFAEQQNNESFLDKKAVLQDKHYFLHRFHKHFHNKQKKYIVFMSVIFYILKMTFKSIS